MYITLTNFTDVLWFISYQLQTGFSHCFNVVIFTLLLIIAEQTFHIFPVCIAIYLHLVP